MNPAEAPRTPEQPDQQPPHATGDQPQAGAPQSAPQSASQSARTTADEPAQSGQQPATPQRRPRPRPGHILQTQFNDGRDYPRLGNFSFRRGTLTPNQEATWQEHWPQLGRELADDVINLEQWFGRSADTIVEIGSGTGTSTAAMAPLEADKNVVAVEIYRPGLAKLLGAVVRGDIRNVRMVKGDGVEVLQRMFAPESLAGVRVFFPDPWPKARHHKRRILQTGTLHLIAQRLRPGGVLHVATDHADYAEWIDNLVHSEPQLRYLGWPAEVPILTDRQVRTKFESKGLSKEHTIRDYLWVKQP